MQASKGQRRLDEEVSLERGALEEGTVAQHSISLGITSSATLRSETILLFFPAVFLLVKKIVFVLCFWRSFYRAFGE